MDIYHTSPQNIIHMFMIVFMHVDMCRISYDLLSLLDQFAKSEASMRSGSVIVDLAAPTGGNCVYTEPNRAVMSPNGVTIVGVAWSGMVMVVMASL